VKESTAQQLVPGDMMLVRMNKILDAIARRACEIFHWNGRRVDRGLDNWFQAEAMDQGRSRGGLSANAPAGALSKPWLGARGGTGGLLLRGFGL
jgi:hypothetical protein